MPQRYRIPHSIEFPFGYVVLVDQVAPDHPALVDADGNKLNGCWEANDMAIYIDRSLSPAEKRGIFVHEFNHAYTDWSLWLPQNVPIKWPQAMDPDPEEREDEE